MTEAAIYDMFFAGLVVLVGWRTRGNLRAWLWLAAGSGAYIVSAVYFRLGFPQPIVMAAVSDALVIAAIYAVGKYRWEMGLWRIFQFMFAVNIVAFAYFIHPDVLPIEPSRLHNVHAAMLDIGNIAALGWIWLNGARQRKRTDEHVPPAHALPFVRRAIVALRGERAHRPFWEIAR